MLFHDSSLSPHLLRFFVWPMEFLISAIYICYFAFISRCIPLSLYPVSFSSPSFPSVFFPGYGNHYIRLAIRLAACSNCDHATLHGPVDCIPFELPRTNASFDSRNSKKEFPSVPSSLLLVTCIFLNSNFLRTWSYARQCANNFAFFHRSCIIELSQLMYNLFVNLSKA